MGDTGYSLSKLTLVTPAEVMPGATLAVRDGYIAGLEGPAGGYAADLRDHLAYPALINSHDHMFGTWWPRVAPRRPYRNVYEWLADYETSRVLVERGQHPVQDLYELGVYRNLISGVTTVADHFKRSNGPEFYTRLLIHVLYEYGRTWTARQATSWGADVEAEYGLAVRTGQPYIIHLAEGLDPEVAAEMDLLLEAQALGRNTMIVHGIALRPQDMVAMAEVGASLCWCPASNLYLYDRTADIPALMRAGVNIALGTDSSMTGGLNLLAEVRSARDLYCRQAGEDPPGRWLVELMTSHAAHALMLEGRRGRIAVGLEADLLVLPASHVDPYLNLVEAGVQDVALLVCRGAPVYGDVAYLPLFEEFGGPFSSVLVAGRRKLIAGDPLGLLDRLSAVVGRQLDFPFLPLVAPGKDGRQP
jgi:5-methylthioadenosine/S-adenosylhomocysteine deaminase